MTDLLQRLGKNIQDRQLLKHGQSVLVAVSGGVDSMVLLHTLYEHSKRHRWKLTIAHFNHQLRGPSSNADEQLVQGAAAALKLPSVVGRANVRQFAKKSKLSIEMAARKLRHQFLARLARERKISTVALAHQADDQVELFFLRILRGTGGEGLAGMKWSSPSPVNDSITLVRPLLDATKAELLAFARENEIHFREDATNATQEIPRNRIRNELLPLLRRRYQAGLTKAILRLMDIVGAEADVVTEVARQWIKADRTDLPVSRVARYAPKAFGAGRVSTGSSFGQLPVALQRRVLQLQLVDLGVEADFDLVERLRRAPGVFISVSSDFSVSRDKAGKVGLQARLPVDFKRNELTVNLAGRAGEVDFSGVHLHWSFAKTKNTVRLGKHAGRECFDADEVGGQITLRHWRAGDRFQPIGLKSAVKLQDLFTNQKIPRARRHDLIVAEAAGGQIFWVQNLRMSELFKLTPNTRRRLVWRWQPV